VLTNKVTELYVHLSTVEPNTETTQTWPPETLTRSPRSLYKLHSTLLPFTEAQELHCHLSPTGLTAANFFTDGIADRTLITHVICK
jgi:hypothetical protein